MPTSAQARRLTPRGRDTPVIELVVVSHPDLSPSLFFANNTPGDDITSAVTGSSETYTAFPMQIVRPAKGEETPKARVVIQNVDREIGEVVNELRGPLTVDLYSVMPDIDPDEAVETYEGLKLRNVTVDAISVSGDLVDDDLAGEPCPPERITPNRFPALFRF